MTTYIGTTDDETFILSLGNDTVNADAGFDTLVFEYGLSSRNQTLTIYGGNLVDGFNGVMTDGYGDLWYATFSGIERYTVTTGSGNDALYTNGSVDTLSTGSGNDYILSGTGDDVVDLGEGTDAWSADKSGVLTDISVNFATGAYSGPGSATGFEYTTTFWTGSGNDQIVTSGLLANESLFGGAGDDAITLVRGQDVAHGGTGFDTLVLDYSASSRNQNMTNTSGNALDGYSGVMSDGYGDQWYATFLGIERFDIKTGTGNDVIYTYDSVDTVSTGSGDDYIVSGTGADLVDLGDGTDAWSADKSGVLTDISVNFATGSYSGPGSAIGFEYTTSFWTGSGNDQLVTSGLIANENLYGGTGDDSFTLVRGQDVVIGDGGFDTLVLNYGASTRNQNMTNVAGNAADGYSGTMSDGYGDQWYGTFGGIERFIITTGSGNDTLYSYDSVDTISSGSGDDYIWSGTGDDVVDLGDGTDAWGADKSAESADISVNFVTGTYSGPGSATGFEYTTTFSTGTGADVLTTGELIANETLNSGAGDDQITLVRGQDAAHGNEGYDTLYLEYSQSSRNQTLTNTSGSLAAGYSGVMSDGYGDQWYATFTGIEAFYIFTGSGSDTVFTYDSQDHVATKDGNDYVWTGSGLDVVNLGDGIDAWGADKSAEIVNISIDFNTGSYTGPGSATGFEYTTTFSTGSGNDVIATSDIVADETLNSGAGNDRIKLVRGQDVANGGTGADTLVLDYAASSRNQVMNAVNGSLLNGFSGVMSDGYGDQWYATFSGIEHFEVITGSGHDTVVTGEGDDIFRGNGGNDTLVGGAGVDTAIYSGDLASYQGGTDAFGVTTLVDVRGGSPDGTDWLTGIEQIRFADVTVDIGFVSSIGVVINGTAANDVVSLTKAPVSQPKATLRNDVIFGRSGNDKLDGNVGGDIMFGGAGNDTYTVDNLADRTVESSGEGTDTVSTGLSHTLAANLENLILTGVGVVDGAGNELKNKLTGNSADNRLDGGVGDDTLIGGAGNDVLVGEWGADKLTGGIGADTFVFELVSDLGTSKTDTIKDFSSAEFDLIDLSAIDANGGLAGDAAFAFIGSASFSRTAGELRYAVAGTGMTLQADLDGDGRADLAVKFTGVTSILAGDIIL